MGVGRVRTLPKVTCEATVVWSYDPCVEPKDGQVGWVPVGDAILSEVDGQCADQVTVRPLGPTESVQAEDEGGTRARNLARVRSAITAVNGVNRRKVIRRWIDEVATLDSTPLTLLGIYVSYLTRGSDPARGQRFALGVEDPDSESDDDADSEGD